jgi:hypothetical protein
MLKSLAITTLILNSLIISNSSFISSAYASLKLKESPPPKSNAQGTRGCPIRLGDLALFGGAKQKEQLTLDLNVKHPLLLYQVTSDQPEKVLLTITQVDGKFARRLIHQQEINAFTGNYTVLRLPKLQLDKTYLLTIGLLCQNKPQYGKSLHAWLNLVNTETQVNTFVQTLQFF